MYARRVQEETLEFGHRGWLLDRSFIFYDRQYDSLWVQATGQCIKGKFKGQHLATLPVTHATWGAWRALHPETVVLAKPVSLIARYRRDAYEQAYANWGTTFGLAVFVPDGQKLYPLQKLHDRPVVHDTIADQPVLVVYHRPSQTAVAFDPVIAGTPVQFELLEVAESDVLLREPATGTIWSGLTGRTQSRGEPPQQLRQLRTTQFVVENWQQHFPKGETFDAP